MKDAIPSRPLFFDEMLLTSVANRWYNQEVNKLQFIGESSPHRAKRFESFAQAFSKACRSRRDRRSRLARREIFLSFKAPQRGELRHSRKRGKTQVGFSPFYAKAILIVYPLFSLAQEAQEKSLAKKKRRKRSFAACERRPTLRALGRRHLLEKRWTKTTAVLPWRTLRQIKI